MGGLKKPTEKTWEGLSDIGLRVAVTDDSRAVVAADFNGRIVSFDATSGAALGELDANPPALAERLAVAREAVGSAAATEAAARAAADAATAALEAATAALRDAERTATAAREALDGAAAAATAARSEEARWQEEIEFAARRGTDSPLACRPPPNRPQLPHRLPDAPS